MALYYAYLCKHGFDKKNEQKNHPHNIAILEGLRDLQICMGLRYYSLDPLLGWLILIFGFHISTIF